MTNVASMPMSYVALEYQDLKLLLIYHDTSKRIISMVAPYPEMVQKLGYPPRDLGEVLTLLVLRGWKEVERGKPNFANMKEAQKLYGRFRGEVQEGQE